MAGAGVGCLGIVDGDCVEVSNLHRQILHKTTNLGSFKADSVKDYIRSCVFLTMLTWTLTLTSLVSIPS